MFLMDMGIGRGRGEGSESKALKKLSRHFLILFCTSSPARSSTNTCREIAIGTYSYGEYRRCQMYQFDCIETVQ